MINRLIKLVDALVNAAVLLFVALILLVSVYSLLDNYAQYRDAHDDSLLVYKPALDGRLAKDRLISGNQVAWLTLYGTSIDYPVMQGESNYEYLNKDPYGEFKLSGSIFMDCANARDFSDPYSLIYGHHMEYGSMFGALDEYLNEAYFNQYDDGVLVTGDRTWRIELFAVAMADGMDPTIFSPSGRTTEEITAYLDENATLYRHYDKGCPILALSTCYGDTYNSRLVVFGMLKGQ